MVRRVHDVVAMPHRPAVGWGMTTSSLHKPVMAASSWRDNGEMIADVVRLGYIDPDDDVLDMTWGSGVWWRKYEHPGPFTAICNDTDKATGILKTPPARPNVTVQTADFRALPFEPESFDVVVFDPPYVSKGGRTTSTIPKFLDAYGLRDAESTPERLHTYNMGGLAEAATVARKRGYILVKCMNYISSGKLQPVEFWTYRDAMELGLQLVEKWTHVGGAGPQPKTNLDGSERRQEHARNNCSVLFIFRKPRGWKPRHTQEAS